MLQMFSNLAAMVNSMKAAALFKRGLQSVSFIQAIYR